MVFCENDGGNCLNENDNPHVDGSTICKQLYKTQKLLAIDEEGTQNWNSLFYWRKYIIPIICIELLLNFNKHFIQEKSALIHLNYHRPVFVITKNRLALKLWVESLKKVIHFQHFCPNIQFHFGEQIVVMAQWHLNQSSTLFMVLQNHQVLKMKIASLLFGLLMLNRGQEDIPIH